MHPPKCYPTLLKGQTNLTSLRSASWRSSNLTWSGLNPSSPLAHIPSHPFSPPAVGQALWAKGVTPHYYATQLFINIDSDLKHFKFNTTLNSDESARRPERVGVRDSHTYDSPQVVRPFAGSRREKVRRLLPPQGARRSL